MFEALRVSAKPIDMMDNVDALLSHIGLDVKSITWEDVQKRDRLYVAKMYIFGSMSNGHLLEK